jgi:hypothetical protein
MWQERDDQFISGDQLIYELGRSNDLRQTMDLNDWNKHGIINIHINKRDVILTNYEIEIMNKFNKNYEKKLKFHLPGSGFIFTPQQIKFFTPPNMLPNKYYLCLCLEY